MQAFVELEKGSAIRQTFLASRSLKNNARLGLYLGRAFLRLHLSSTNRQYQYQLPFEFEL